MLRSGLRIANPSVVCNVRAPYTQGVETFGNISSPFCTLAILTSLQNFTEIVPGEPLRGGVKRKRSSKTERFHTLVSHLLMSFLYSLLLCCILMCRCIRLYLNLETASNFLPPSFTPK